ncbi:MAG: hypothetical protein U9Q66_02820 [Patescibacteria group bacterium]|nr:hypothetical protein [Patescibacteria group bacterium]
MSEFFIESATSSIDKNSSSVIIHLSNAFFESSNKTKNLSLSDKSLLEYCPTKKAHN